MNIITLSTIPPRFEMIGETLESLVAQTAEIDKIILYIPRIYRRFPDYDGHLPPVPEGVEIVRVDNDLGPATKVLPAIREFQGKDVNILFCDDDRIFQSHWADTLLKAADEHPGCATTISILIASEQGADNFVPDLKPRAVFNRKKTDVEYRLKRIWSQLDIFNLYTSPNKPARKVLKSSGYADIFEGVNGVLVRPEFFDDAVFDIPAKLWAVDDVWLSGHVTRMGVPIWATAETYSTAETRAHNQTPLHGATIEGLVRDDANAACIRYFQNTYGIWV
ncbi:MAG: glycosyltransferase family 2 protein [Rhodobacteraceae bacterium]|nr:glycosyltransferase family 2 protein [Paracoccaceae bacterium]